jgi:hypothetical protein
MSNETKKQTAVEWLLEQFYNNEGMITTKQLEKAKAMEKEQIKYSFGQGSLFEPVFPDQFHYRADDYYQHHYGQ